MQAQQTYIFNLHTSTLNKQLQIINLNTNDSNLQKQHAITNLVWEKINKCKAIYTDDASIVFYNDAQQTTAATLLHDDADCVYAIQFVNATAAQKLYLLNLLDEALYNNMQVFYAYYKCKAQHKAQHFCVAFVKQNTHYIANVYAATADALFLSVAQHTHNNTYTGNTKTAIAQQLVTHLQSNNIQANLKHTCNNIMLL